VPLPIPTVTCGKSLTIRGGVLTKMVRFRSEWCCQTQSDYDALAFRLLSATRCHSVRLPVARVLQDHGAVAA
jgi:hypothetical protein